MNQHRLLHELLPYRMQAVDTFNVAIYLRRKWREVPPMTIQVNGKSAVEGSLNAFTNPVIEAGLVHCRALLEFLGLCLTRDARLGNVKKRRRGDIGIEHFKNADGYLAMVKPDDALSGYQGPRSEAENALIAVFQVANKGLVHTTEDLTENPEHGWLLEIASRGIPSLVVRHLYMPLGLASPDYKIRSRLRDSLIEVGAASGAARPFT